MYIIIRQKFESGTNFQANE